MIHVGKLGYAGIKVLQSDAVTVDHGAFIDDQQFVFG
jgi:hypothetical protein